MNTAKLNTAINHMRHHVNIRISHVSYLFMGAGYAYTVQNNQPYWHIPILFLFPSGYVGYNVYKNKDQIIEFVKPLMK